MITELPRHEPPRADPPADAARIWRLLAVLSEAGGFAGYVGWTISDRPAGTRRVEHTGLTPSP